MVAKNLVTDIRFNVDAQLLSRRSQEELGENEPVFEKAAKVEKEGPLN